MTNFETAIRPIYNLIYLVIALGVINLIGFLIYKRNVKQRGRREAYGSGWAVSIPLCALIVVIWAFFIA